jgi:Acetyltransferase (GNAT) domain
MVLFERSFGIMKYLLSYFPCDTLLDDMARTLPWTCVLHAHQIGVHRTDYSNLLSYRRSWTACVDLTESLDTIYKRMSASCRYKVRKAQKVADRIVVRTNHEGVCRDFLKIHNDHARQKGHSGPISQRVLENYLRTSDVLVMEFDGTPISAHLVLRDPGVSTARCIYLASTRLAEGTDPVMVGTLNRYLHWHCMEKYKREEFAVYDMGGLQDPKGPVGSYKLSFGADLVEDHSYWFGRLTFRLPYRALRRFKSPLMGRVEN